MKGLIKKDLLMIKSNFKTLGIIFIIYTILGFQDSMNIGILIPFLGSMMIMSTFSYDSYNKWDAYAITFPNGRENIVKSKYLANFLFVSLLSIFELLILLVISFIQKEISSSIFLSIYTMFFATMVFQDLIYPIIFRFGIEKARLSIFLAVFILILAIIGIAKLLSFKIFAGFLNLVKNHLFLSLTLILIIMTYISYKISQKIYLKKEF